MQVDYAPFVGRMINKYEGPYGWSRKDPGGPTKYGITCYDLAEHRGQKMTSMAEWAPLVEAMTLAEAEDIYATKYAKAVDFNDLPAGPDVVGMDYAVNSGIARPIIVWRQLLNVAGKNTMDLTLLKAIEKTDPKWIVDQTCEERLRFMHAIRGGSAWVEFGHGWQARVDDVRAYGEHLVAGGTHETAPPPPDLSTISAPKVQHAPQTTGSKTAGGIIGAGVAAHLAGVSPWGVAGVVGALIAGGILYEVYEEHKAAAANAVVA